MKKGKERAKIIKELLDITDKEFTDEELIQQLTMTEIVENNSNEKTTFGQKAADAVAKFAGSWAFIFSFVAVMVIWMIVNVVLSTKAFDAYPFILLNLVLSCIAAVQAPLIMMSQNRQEVKDRKRAENDYKINLKNELIIDDLHKKIELILENQNKELGSYIKQQGYYPLILKGNEKEFYKGEQRDLLLYLLKEELKNNHNQKQQQIIHTILEQNPPVGNRNRYLTDIFNLLVNEGLSKKSIDTLSRYGIILNHTGKHPTTTFFNDSRYTMTFSSTPSDLNVGRQYYRQIRKLFF